jgi:hypothetical protein
MAKLDMNAFFDGLKPGPAERSKSVSWCEDITSALNGCGGRARLAELYELVGLIRHDQGRSVPFNLQATIRCQLQRFPNRFRPVDRGIWELIQASDVSRLADGSLCSEHQGKQHGDRRRNG